jgi:hypothetical protein
MRSNPRVISMLINYRTLKIVLDVFVDARDHDTDLLLRVDFPIE